MRPTIILLLLLLLISSIAALLPAVQAGTYLEAGGLVVMEAERTPSALDLWQVRTDIAGFTGSGHLEFTGNSEVSGGAKSPLTYTFTIANAGTYRLIIRAGRTAPEGTPNDQANDCYVRMDGDFTAGGDAPLDWLTSNTKFFGAKEDSWSTWSQTLDRNHAKESAEYVFKAGETYVLTIHGRSRSYTMDRIVLFKTDSHSLSTAKNTDLAESGEAGGGGGGTSSRSIALTLPTALAAAHAVEIDPGGSGTQSGATTTFTGLARGQTHILGFIELVND